MRRCSASRVSDCADPQLPVLVQCATLCHTSSSPSVEGKEVGTCARQEVVSWVEVGLCVLQLYVGSKSQRCVLSTVLAGCRLEELSSCIE
jgi:hypothetical protein